MTKDFHPVAEIFPMLDGDPLDSLVADIRSHGQREAITLHPDGRIVDGRNRYRACMLVGESPIYRTWNEERDGELLPYVVSLNLKRRHLSEGQRGMVAAKLANLELGANQHKIGGSANLPTLPVTQAQAAEMLNVSPRTVRAARAVIQHGVPELVAAAHQGDISVNMAEAIARTDPDEQRALIASPKAERVKAARDIRGTHTDSKAEPPADSTPIKLDRGPEAAKKRRDQIREMAAAGYTVPDIALAIGLTEASTRGIIGEHRIDVVASKVMGKLRRHDATRILESIVMDAENLTTDVGLINLSEIDRDQLGTWIDALERSRRKLSEFINTLKKEHQKHGEAA